MTTLIEFLEARLEEDEAVAQAATSGPWNDDGGCISSEHYQITDYGSYTKADGEPEEWEDEQRRADSAHMTRHDPARVLREVAAKRAIVKDHQIKPATWSEPDDAEKFGCERCHFDRDEGVYGFGYCPTLKALAAVYSDHESYREEWAA